MTVDLTGLSKLARTPSNFLWLVGMGMLSWAIYKGQFSTHNPLVAWGLIAPPGAFAWDYLSRSRSSLFDGERTTYFWHVPNLLLGSGFLALAIFLAWKAYAGWAFDFSSNSN